MGFTFLKAERDGNTIKLKYPKRVIIISLIVGAIFLTVIGIVLGVVIPQQQEKASEDFIRKSEETRKKFRQEYENEVAKMDKDREEAWKKSDEEFKARSTQIDNDNNRRFEQELNRAKDNFPSIFDNIPSKSDNPKPTPIANPEPKKEEPKKEEPKKEEPKKEESKKETSIMNIGNSFKCDFDCSSIQNRCKFDCFPNDCNDQCTKAYQECKSKC